MDLNGRALHQTKPLRLLTAPLKNETENVFPSFLPSDDPTKSHVIQRWKLQSAPSVSYDEIWGSCMRVQKEKEVLILNAASPSLKAALFHLGQNRNTTTATTFSCCFWFCTLILYRLGQRTFRFPFRRSNILTCVFLWLGPLRFKTCLYNVGLVTGRWALSPHPSRSCVFGFFFFFFLHI